MKLDTEKIRKDFPILEKNLIYLDNACMSLKPKCVFDKLKEYYYEYSACVGRSQHRLAEKVGLEVEKARNIIKKFINANSEKEIIFTRNTTEGINLVANSLGLEKDDEVIISDKEHNSNLIPWLKLRNKIGIKVVICKSNDDNTFNVENFENCFSEKTKLVSIGMTSNLDGITNPIKEITKIAHENSSLVLVDAAQSIPHKKIDVKEIDVDFFAFSGHKMLGPTGTGVLYGKKELLEKLEQFIVGGGTVVDSTYEDYEPEKIPNKFEAGLQDYAGIIGLGEACNYLLKIGMKNIEEHEIELNKIVTEELKDNDKIEIIGPIAPELRSGIFSFNIKGMDPHHVSRMAHASKNIMTRSGAHCVHSWFNAKKMEGSVRASFYLYNTEEEAKIFAEEIKKIAEITF